MERGRKLSCDAARMSERNKSNDKDCFDLIDVKDENVTIEP